MQYFIIENQPPFFPPFFFSSFFRHFLLYLFTNNINKLENISYKQNKNILLYIIYLLKILNKCIYIIINSKKKKK